MNIEYNKLVRDRIPEIIAADGKHAVTVGLDEVGFVAALRVKLVEEAQEAVRSERAELRGGFDRRLRLIRTRDPRAAGWATEGGPLGRQPT